MARSARSTGPGTERALIVAVDLQRPKRALDAGARGIRSADRGDRRRRRGSHRAAACRPSTRRPSSAAARPARSPSARTRSGATKVFVFNDLRPRQRTNLEKIIPLPIVDRTMVILDIFAQRARSREGQLQVELAQLRHRQANSDRGRRRPSRLGGGVGTRGPGETKLETDRRESSARLRAAPARSKTCACSARRAARRAASDPLVALVGYTNVGKSSLLNRLARARHDERAFVADQPFATLDPTLRRVYVAPGRHAAGGRHGRVHHRVAERTGERRFGRRSRNSKAPTCWSTSRRVESRLAASGASVEAILAELNLAHETYDHRLQQEPISRRRGPPQPGRLYRDQRRRPAPASTRCAPRSLHAARPRRRASLE